MSQVRFDDIKLFNFHPEIKISKTETVKNHLKLDRNKIAQN